MARYFTDRVIPLSGLTPLPEPPPAIRLRLATGRAGRGGLDGGWWPRSRNAAAELPELVSELMGPSDRVVRLGVDLNDWNRVPRRIVVGGRVLKVGWLPHLDHIVTVVFGRQNELMLLVVPPGAAEDNAHAALAMASSGLDGVRPQMILAGCDISTARGHRRRRGRDDQ